MLSALFDLLHMAAAAIFAVIGIGYDRIDACADPVRQYSAEEVSLAAPFEPDLQAAGFQAVVTIPSDPQDLVRIQLLGDDGLIPSPARLCGAPAPSGFAQSLPPLTL